MNFIHVQDLLGFAKARLGVKWYVLPYCLVFYFILLFYFRNMFSSEKVLQMSYANYQFVSSFLLPDQ